MKKPAKEPEIFILEGMKKFDQESQEYKNVKIPNLGKPPRDKSIEHVLAVGAAVSATSLAKVAVPALTASLLKEFFGR